MPDGEIFPPCYPEATVLTVEEAATRDCHIKRPKTDWYSLHRGTNDIAEYLLLEARSLEMIEHNPHSNIIQFEGCIVRNGLITGLCLKRYPELLRSKFSAEENDEPVTPPSTATIDCWIHDLGQAIDHLHALGFAHNDVNPSNIMLDEEGRAVLIDLGSCVRLGEVMHGPGTHGWNEGFEERSSVENDKSGLMKVEEWLRDIGVASEEVI